MQKSAAAAMFERLQAARLCADARRQAGRYAEACGSSPGLGGAVRVEGDALVAVRDIPGGTPITAFPADVAVYADPSGGTHAIDMRRAGQGFEAEALGFAVKHFAMPLAGYAPLVAIVADPTAKHIAPDMAGALVGDVVSENPYHSVLGISPESGTAGASGGTDSAAAAPPGWSEAMVPAIAQVAAAHIARIGAESNARVGCAPGRPIVVISNRAIRAGEPIVSGRRPLYWMGNDTRLAEAVFSHLAKEQAATHAQLDELRAQIGLPPGQGQKR